MAIIFYLIQDIKIIHSLVRLNKHIFFNSFKKTDTWLKVVTIILFVYAIYQSALAGGLSAVAFSSIVNSSSKYYFPAVNISLFVLVIVNIITPIFLSTSKYSDRIGTKLSYYPLSLFKVILLGIFASTLDVYNLFFIPFYVVIVFAIGGINSFAGFIFSVIVLFLFIFMIGNVIYLLKNLFLLITTDHKRRKLFTYFGAGAIILLFFYMRRISLIFTKPDNIFILSNSIQFLPSGVLAYLIAHTKNDILSSNAGSLVYFVLINFLFYCGNLRVQKKLKGRGKVLAGKKLDESGKGLTIYIKKYAINPIIKKDLIYTFRSTREKINTIMIVCLVPIGAFLIMQNILSSSVTPHDTIFLIEMLIYFYVLFIFRYSCNFFGYDYNGVINYFSKPINYSELIKSKLNTFKFIIVYSFIGGTICLFLIKISVINYLLFTSYIILMYLVIKSIGALLSIYFPLSINFYSLTGMNFTLKTFGIILVITAVVLTVSYLLFSYLIDVQKELASIMLLLFSYLLIKSKNKINSYIVKLLVNKKEKVISACS